jgi:PAS domain S-box-containing protein
MAELTPVRLLLKWDHQYQFAGYYAAQWQGLYEEEGLDVTFTPRPRADGTLRTIPEEMLQSKADFALGGPDLLQYVDQGMPFVLISSMYQRSPFKFFVRADSNIHSVADLFSSCIEASGDFGELELKTLFKKEGFNLDRIQWSDFNFGLQSLVDKSCDVVVDYDTSGSWAAKEKNLQVRKISAEQFGVNFYGDVLFTTKHLVDSNPLLVEKFRRASIKGWHYAMENPEEISKKIVKNFQRVFNFDDELGYHLFTAQLTKDLMNYPMVEAGHTSTERWRQINRYLFDINAVDGLNFPDWFIFDYVEIQEHKRSKTLTLIIFLVTIFSSLILIWLYSLRVKRKRKEIELLDALEDKEILSSVINLLPMGVFWKDAESRYLGGNNLFLKGTGLSSDAELIGKTDYEMPWAGMAKKHIDDDLSVLDESNPEQKPYEMLEKTIDGKERWFLARKIPLRNKFKEIVGVVGAYQDISKFKKAYAELEEQRIASMHLLNRMKGLISSSPDMIYYKDYRITDGSYVICNKYFEDWVGLHETELYGKKDIDLFDSISADKYRKEDLAVIKNKSKFEIERLIKTVSGKEIIYEFIKVPVFTREGDIDGLLCVGKDITQARELESINQVLFSATNDAYFVLGLDGSVANCNEKAVEFLGVSNKDSVIGLKLIDSFTPEFQPDGKKSIDLAVQSNKYLNTSDEAFYSTSFVYQDINGKPLYMDVFLAKISNGHTLLQWHDISESKEKQKRLEKAKKDAEELASTKSLFLANMSHEIRTPLNAIVGLGGLLSKNIDKDKTKLYVDSINTSSRHLLSVINDILDFSKLEANKMTIELVKIDLKELVESVRCMYERQAIDASINLSINSEGMPDFILSDPTKLKQILSNLVSNAIKFSNNGEVNIGCELKEDNLHLWIKDSGIGIDKDRISRLFDPFTQDDISTTRKFGGTGLGLSICKRLAEILGGTIQVDSEHGAGAVFTVVLPYTEIDSSEQVIEQVAIKNIAPDLSGKRILIAEDNALNQLVIEELLVETKASITIVDNGRQAVDAILGSNFDLILMDIQMPVLDGISAAKEIRESGLLGIPIVALTANTGDEERIKAIESGMNDFMTKPIDQNILFGILQAWL